MKTIKRARNVTAPKTASPHKQRIFLVDDHAIVRRGLQELIDNEPDLSVCGQGEDAYGSLRAIRDSAPDLCVIDVSLKDSDGRVREQVAWAIGAIAR